MPLLLRDDEAGRADKPGAAEGEGARLARLEEELCRLRRVLLVLGRDRPDLLRLLGQPTREEGNAPGPSNRGGV